MNHVTYQASGFVVVQVHERPGESGRAARVIALLLANVDEALRELVAVVDVVAAAAPDPVAVE